MAGRTISKWRWIDQGKLAQRILALGIGFDDPVEVEQVKGPGAPTADGRVSRDTDWRRRLAAATSQPDVTKEGNPVMTSVMAQIELDATLADEQLENAKQLSEEQT